MKTLAIHIGLAVGP